MSELLAPPPLVPSLLLTPAVVAHRGASGYRPEHTVEAYRTAVRMGADDVEIDLVCTADGVLVARHENELSATTDVACRPQYAARRTRRRVDGRLVEGWFTEDFTVAELKTLTARERWPVLRPRSAAHDGRHGIPTFTEVLAMVGAESVRTGRSIGVMAELKHAAHFAARGLSVERALLGDLRRHGLDHPRSRVSVLSFEPGVLRALAGETSVALVQLLGEADRRPADLAAAGEPTTYADLGSPEGLAGVDEYADGIGVHRSLVLPRDGRGRVAEPSRLVRDAHRLWLTVHAWTLRAEERWLPTNLRGPDGLEREAHLLLAAGVDGLITDQPDRLVRLVRSLASSAERPAATV